MRTEKILRSKSELNQEIRQRELDELSHKVTGTCSKEIGEIYRQTRDSGEHEVADTDMEEGYIPERGVGKVRTTDTLSPVQFSPLARFRIRHY